MVAHVNINHGVEFSMQDLQKAQDWGKKIQDSALSLECVSVIQW